ncbi:hypothetical protein BD779DRAFT_1507801 [Infundibulicybe gibba]|nr:hypothetical protein BD779DRAFT_1507801 [Infundibulicybe gibba]
MSKVVFVGNVPYNMGEDQLIDVFKSVGQVIGFRLVFDRDTGKPKGYGFCEFADHETAASAVRNLNGVDVGGRPLRIDLADSDPFLEGKTTVRGELVDGGVPGPSEPRSQWRAGGSDNHSHGRNHDPNAFLSGLPPGIQVPKNLSVLDNISQTLATMSPDRLMEVLAQMKAFVITHPEQARALLVAHPQLAYALFQALLLNNIVDSAILQRMLAATSGSSAPPGPPARTPVPPHIQHQHAPPHYPSHLGYPPAPLQQPQPVSGIPPLPPMSAPPASAMFGHHQHPHHPSPMPPMPPYYRPPPSAPASSAPPPQQPQQSQDITESQHAMLMQVLNMGNDQISALPDAERATILQLRSQFMGING